MKAHIFERACPLYQEGAISPFLGEISPHKKRPPKSGAVNGTIAGALFKISIFSISTLK
jgi:hypothetical protein